MAEQPVQLDRWGRKAVIDGLSALLCHYMDPERENVLLRQVRVGVKGQDTDSMLVKNLRVSAHLAVEQTKKAKMGGKKINKRIGRKILVAVESP
jgi:hypothetical protein